MLRQVRSDKNCRKDGNRPGLATGPLIRNKDGRDTRSDKKLGSIRRRTKQVEGEMFRSCHLQKRFGG